MIVRGIAEGRDLREWVTYWAALTLAVLVFALAYRVLSTAAVSCSPLSRQRDRLRELGVRIWRTKLLVDVAVGGVTAMVGALIFLQKLASPRTPPSASTTGPPTSSSSP